MMKLRSTTPASLSTYAKKGFLVLSALVLVGAGIFYANRPASADQYDDKIRALQADMARYQAEADRLNAEATTLANALAQITNEKNALQAQIDVNQAQHDKLIIEIADTEKQIKENQDALGSTIADLYVDDSISPVEMLASSQNINEFLDKQEYRNSVKDELGSTIKKVRSLKEQLTSKKEEVAKVLESQKQSRDALASKESEQANLLARTQNDEASYQNMIKDSEGQIRAARAAQAALNARANSTGGVQIVNAGQLSSYPWNTDNCYVDGNALSHGGADGNGGDRAGNVPKYGCRQCASYVAWRVARQTGVYYWNWGNGGNFANAAIGAGYQNLGRSPQKNSIAVMWGNPGHVAYVEDVSADGSQVYISQYNYYLKGYGWGYYSEMWVSTNFFDQYVKV